MKKSTLVIMLLTFMGCDKEVPIQTVFDFEMEALHAENGVTNAPIATEINIIPERVIGGTTYSFRYTVVQGIGNFQKAGVPVAPNEWTSLEGSALVLNYIPASTGAHEVNVFVRENSGKYEHSQTLTYNIGSNGFIFTAAPTSTQTIVGSPVNINFSINPTTAGAVTYTLQFESTLSGVFSFGGVAYAAGESIAVSAGAGSGTYTGNAQGVHTISLTVTNSDGTAHEDTFMITVDPNSPTLNNVVFDYDKYDEVILESFAGGGGGYTNQNWYMRLLINNLDYSTYAPLTHIVIDGVEYSLGGDIQIGYIYYNSTYNMSGSSVSANDDNITLKRNTEITVQVRDANGNYSNSIILMTPTFYGFDFNSSGTGGVYFNGGYMGSSGSI